MACLRWAPTVGTGCALLLSAGTLPLLAQTPPPIRFEVPAVVDPIHTNGEPDIGIDPFGRVFVSGPTGTGTQRSVWLGSVDRGHTFRVISPGLPPSAIAGIVDPPGGGDTDINFDRTGKQYFADLYALACLRTAVTSDGGATVAQEIYPAGCSGVPGADRQWLAVSARNAGASGRVDLLRHGGTAVGGDRRPEAGQRVEVSEVLLAGAVEVDVGVAAAGRVDDPRNRRGRQPG